jgi:hypothetical protein
MGESNLSKQKVLAKLHDTGRSVTERQLERWWKAGHMDRPQRKHLPGLKGSTSVFPARAFDQAAALYDATHPHMEVASTDRRLDERAFLLWWSGQPVARDPRQILLDFASPMLGAIEAVRAYEGATIVDPRPEGDDNAIFDVCEQFFLDHPPDKFKARLFRAFFRNLGRRSDDMFSVMVTIAAGALGFMPLLEPSHHPDEPSLSTLVLRAFGFGEFQLDASPETQVYNVVKNIALFADRQKITEFVLALSDDELETARRCARTFLEGLPPIFESQNLLFGKKALATLLRAFVEMATPGLKATMAIGMAWMLRQELGANALRLAEQIEENAPKSRALCTAARAFPEYRALFSHENLSKLAELPEEKKREILAVLKAAVA